MRESSRRHAVQQAFAATMSDVRGAFENSIAKPTANPAVCRSLHGWLRRPWPTQGQRPRGRRARMRRLIVLRAAESILGIRLLASIPTPGGY
jgi:hypothetical protein